MKTILSVALFAAVAVLGAVTVYVALDMTQAPGRSTAWNLEAGVRSFMTAFRRR